MEDKKAIEVEICGLKELIEQKFSNIYDRLDNNDIAHEKIITQTTKTNGSVRSLQIWRAYITGGLAVSCFITSIAVVLLAKILN